MTLTNHAKSRLQERSKESESSLNALLEQGKTIKIGSEPSSNRCHHLFWSEIDQLHHVLILDEKTQEAITILPIDYHENISWKISEDALKLAKALATNSTIISEEFETEPPVHAKISIRSQNQTISLGKFTFSNSNLLNDPPKEFFRHISKVVQQKKINPNKIEALFVEEKEFPTCFLTF